MDHKVDVNKLVERLKNSIDLKNEKRAFTRFLGPFVWFITESPEEMHAEFEKIQLKMCKRCKANPLRRKKCIKQVKTILRKARTSKHAEAFICQGRLHGFCYPLAQGEKIYGYLVVCQVKRTPSPDILEIFSAYTDTVVKEIQKELELQKLCDTIRPRAIALSTVHTLHRLISSTLNLNELLPRIARLSLQVMRASRCSIKLLDSKKKILLPKATVDLRKKMTKLKKVKIGRWAPGKAVKYTKSIRGRNFLATPLIDEDVIGVITIYDKIDKKSFNDFDEEIMRTLCEQAVIAIKNAQLFMEQEKLTMGAIKSIAAILETKATGTLLPRDSFLKIVHLIGQELKLSDYELKCLQYATILHDAGQIAVPDAVIKKKGLLTGKEYGLIKEHPEKAALILKPIKSLKSIVPIILHHHEHYDGTGYPSRLKGNNIPLEARILGVVSAFEAMIAKKPYRKELSIDEAINKIKRNSGRQFDPKVVEAFLKVVKKKGITKMLETEIYGH
ncbi:MAG: HD domain-containing protein [Candidatus Omnitrophica bacterium]|nr:HD domain-containing protein [Candidatus Omnitrophota bacterium]